MRTLPREWRNCARGDGLVSEAGSQPGSLRSGGSPAVGSPAQTGREARQDHRCDVRGHGRHAVPVRVLACLTLSLLTSCAHPPPPATAPTSAPVFDASCLDVQGQRELLAGVALEGGKLAAALARCSIEKGAANHLADAQEKRAQEAESRELWLTPVVGIGGAILAAVATALIEAYAPHKAAR